MYLFNYILKIKLSIRDNLVHVQRFKSKVNQKLKIKLLGTRNWKRYNGQENLLDFFAMNRNYNYGQKKFIRK